MVITIEITKYGIGKILVDQCSLINILYWKTFRKKDISKDLIVPYNEKIVDFSSEKVNTRGYLDLRMRIGTRWKSWEIWI